MNILVIRYRFIGDTILTIPFLRNLRYAYPDAKIDVLVSPVSGELLEGCPYIDNLLYFDTTRKHRYEFGKSKKKSFFHYVKLLKLNNYDKAFVLKRSLSSALLAFLSGIKYRCGFDTECRGFLLNKRVPYIAQKHEVECFLDVLRAENIEIKDDYLESWVNELDLSEIKKIFEEYNVSNKKKKVVVHATSGNTKKQWSKEYFAQVIQYLSNEQDAQIFFMGAKSDRATYDDILKLIKNELKNIPINLCGKLSINESNALISKMDLVLGNDSGNLHMAGALNIPTIVIYGPMDAKKWRVWNNNTIALTPDIECYPCNLKIKCTNEYKCLKLITPELVIDNIKKVFNKK